MEIGTFIRIQNDKGFGCFFSGVVYHNGDLESIADRHQNFPNFREDDIIREFLHAKKLKVSKMDYRFSFKNIDQFEQWILREEILTLTTYGYRVYKIEATDFVISEFQCIFNINSVKSIVDITNLFI